MDRVSVSFQSRLGKAEWISPDSETVVRSLAASGKKKIVAVCPGFVADNLETLEEIGIRLHETFRAAGGEDLALVPCPNMDPAWIGGFAASVLSEWAFSDAKIEDADQLRKRLESV
jgi:ferrochelatase